LGGAETEGNKDFKSVGTGCRFGAGRACGTEYILTRRTRRCFHRGAQSLCFVFFLLLLRFLLLRFAFAEIFLLRGTETPAAFCGRLLPGLAFTTSFRLLWPGFPFGAAFARPYPSPSASLTGPFYPLSSLYQLKFNWLATCLINHI
jgi:hypothetical protein